MTSQPAWFVYMIETKRGQLYTGITTDVERRFKEHQDRFLGINKLGAKFFLGNEPRKVVYQEECLNRSEASKREYAIKQMSKKLKMTLVESSRSSHLQI